LIQNPELAKRYACSNVPGHIIIRKGNSTSFAKAEKVLYQISGSADTHVHVIETVWNASSFSSGSSYVATTKDEAFVWNGSGAFDHEFNTAHLVVKRVAVSSSFSMA
jgi:hypothetical protein